MSESLKKHREHRDTEKDEVPASQGSDSCSGEATSAAVGEGTQVMLRDTQGNLIPGSPIKIQDQVVLHLPGYEFLSVLGYGGMGTVYLARQISLERYVAIKVIRGAFTESEEKAVRLHDEALTMGGLSHPNVLSCYDIISTADGLFLVMEYIPGRLTGRMLVTRYGVLNEEIMVKVLLEMVDGLSYIYSKGFMHRDLKPDNLMIYHDEAQQATTLEELFHQAGIRTVICDFGIAQSVGAISDESQILGSPMYMAPEQFYARELLDFRADIYSAACVAYFFLTGFSPFCGKEREDVLDFKLSHPVPDPRSKNPSVSRELSRIIQKMGRIHPDDRYQSYQELNDDLERLLSVENFWSGKKRKRERQFLWKGLLAGAALVTLLHSGWLFHEYVWKPHFSTLQISLACSLGYWKRQDNASWSVVAHDKKESSAYLRGVKATPLILQQPLAVGMALDFSMRSFETGTVRFGFLDTALRPLMYVDWVRGEDGMLSVFYLTGEKQRKVFIGEIMQKGKFDWVRMNLKINEKSVVISANDRMLGVAHFHRKQSSGSFFIKVKNTPIVEIKDVYRHVSD